MTNPAVPLTPQYKKLLQALRWRLQGEKFYTAMACLNLAESYSLGVSQKIGLLKQLDYDLQTRKDGVTPEFEHQVRIALHAFTLKDIHDLEALMCVILLHDLMEDYGVEKVIITNVLATAQKDAIWINKVYIAVWAMTKKYQGVTKSVDQVFADIANDPLASIAKGLDRIQNFQSMVGTFSLKKRISYIQEGCDLFLPMLKKARKMFSYQMDAYLNIETVLKYQIDLIKVINDTDYVIAINSEQGVTK